MCHKSVYISMYIYNPKSYIYTGKVCGYVGFIAEKEHSIIADAEIHI